MNKLKSHIDETVKDIVVSGEFKEKIIRTAQSNNKKRIRFSVKKAICIVAAVVVVFSMAVTAFASVNPGANNMICSVSPALAKAIYPVNKSCERSGIKLTVLSAVNDSRSVHVYFTLEDIEGKNRVNERLDFCDTYTVDGPTAFHIEFISYDKSTGKALYCMSGSGTSRMTGKVNRFSFTELMYNKKIYSWYNTGFDLTAALADADIVPMSDYDSYSKIELDTVLLPDVMDIPLKKDVVSVSNIGFIDGRLHIQTKWNKSFDNHGRIALHEKGKEFGEEKIADIQMQQYIYTEEDIRNTGVNRFQKHIEYVFDISPKDLGKYDLWAEIIADGGFIKDKWQVNFRLAQADKIVIKDRSLAAADAFEVSGLGVYIDNYIGNTDNCYIKIRMKNGADISVNHFSSIESFNLSGTKSNLSNEFAEFIDINDITQIELDGKVIFKK